MRGEVKRYEKAEIQTLQAALLSPRTVAPKKALEAVWLRGLPALPAVGIASHLSPGLADETDHLRR